MSLFPSNGQTEQQRDATPAQRVHFAKSKWNAVEVGCRQALEDARQAGLALLEARKQVTVGEWTAFLEKHWADGIRTAQRCIRIAEHWAEVKTAPSITQALYRLAEDAEDSEDATGPVASKKRLKKGDDGELDLLTEFQEFEQKLGVFNRLLDDIADTHGEKTGNEYLFMKRLLDQIIQTKEQWQKRLAKG